MDDSWNMTPEETTTGRYSWVAIVGIEYRYLRRERWACAGVEADWKISGERSGTCEESA